MRRFVLVLAALSACSRHPKPAAPTPAYGPMQAALALFSAPGVPARGPDEPEPPQRSWAAPAALPTNLGNGLGQHPMLFAGEGLNTLFLINNGKVVWTYNTIRGGEIDDVWLMSNGHVLFTRMHYVAEVTPDKQIVWRYECPQGTEIHSAQPIGLDKVLMVRNGLPPKAILIDKKTNTVEMEHELPAISADDPKTVHPQFRRIRMTAQGTYLLPFLKLGKVVEYDKDWKEIWSYEIPTPWAAVRLKNGNTMITDEHDKMTREVNPKGETVWQFTPADLPPGLVLHNTQTADRLSNGNTIIFSATGGVKKEDRPSAIQAIEVTPDKKVVWVLQDWIDLGPATTAQFLDQPGVPERPGDLMH